MSDPALQLKASPEGPPAGRRGHRPPLEAPDALGLLLLVARHGLMQLVGLGLLLLVGHGLMQLVGHGLLLVARHGLLARIGRRRPVQDLRRLLAVQGLRLILLVPLRTIANSAPSSLTWVDSPPPLLGWRVGEDSGGTCSLDGVLEKTLEDLQEITSLAETTAVVPPIYHVIEPGCTPTLQRPLLSSY